MNTLKAYFWQFVALALIAGCLAQTYRLHNTKEELSKTKLEHAVVLKNIADLTAKAYQSVIAQSQKDAKAIAELDKRKTKEVKDATAEIRRLRYGLDNGSVRMRIIGSHYAAPSPGVKASSPSSVDDASTDLSPETGRLVLDLREAIIQDTKALETLQEYVKNYCSVSDQP